MLRYLLQTRILQALAVLLWLVSSLYAQSENALGESDDLKMMHGLQTRQLFRLAEGYAAAKVVEANLTPRARAEIASALIQTYALHALNSPPEQRDALWAAAQTVPQEFINHYPGNPRLLLVRLQSTLGLLSRSELARQEAEVQANNALQLEQAKQLLRQSLEQLKELKQQAEQQQRAIVQETAQGADLFSLTQIKGLIRNIEYQQSRALINQGLCYPAQSADRVNSLSQALLLLKPLTQFREDAPSMWPSRIAEIKCQRLLERFETANERIQTLLKLEPPAEIQLSAKAQQLHILLDQQKVEEALALAEQGRVLEDKTSADLDFAMFQTYLALWKQAEENQQEAEVKRWQANAAVVTAQLDELYGAYWSRRAEMLLTENASSGNTANVDLLIRTADGFYRQSRLTDALKAYDQAIQSAIAAKSNSDQILKLSSTAAAIAAELGDYQDAAKRFRELSLRHPSHEEAAQLHLTGAFNLSLALRRQAMPELDLYQEVLEENTQRWPKSKVNDQAKYWLGKLYALKKQWRAASNTLMQVQDSYSEYQQVVQLCRQTTLEYMTDASRRNELIEQDIQKSIHFFEQLIVKGNQQEGTAWSVSTQVAAETAAELWIKYGQNGFVNAQSIIELAFQSNPAAPASWKNRLQSLLVIALAGQGQGAKARETLSSISSGSAQKLLQMLQSLSDLTKNSPDKTKVELANLQAEVIQMLAPLLKQLSTAEQLQLKLVEVEVLSLQNKRKEALSAMHKLATSFANNQDIQIRYAELLSSSNSADEVKQGLIRWRYIASKARPKTDLWYQAKYEIARAHYRLGSKKEATNVILYLQTLYPDMGGYERKKQFEGLLKRIQSS